VGVNVSRSLVSSLPRSFHQVAVCATYTLLLTLLAGSSFSEIRYVDSRYVDGGSHCQSCAFSEGQAQGYVPSLRDCLNEPEGQSTHTVYDSMLSASIACRNGGSADEIIIQPGTWTGLGRNVYLNLEGMKGVLRGATGNPEDVIIDAGETAFIFEIGINAEVSFCDLTFKNGVAPRMYGAGGVTYRQNAKGLVKGCIFRGHFTEQENSGAALLVGNEANVIVEDCVFDENGVAHRAGAIFVYESRSSFTMRRCIVRDNVADVVVAADSTAGLFIEHSTGFLVEDCIFLNNLVKRCPLESGACIRAYRADGTVRSSLFHSNHDASQFGAGVFRLQPNSAGITISGCTAYNNSADKDGGGVLRSSEGGSDAKLSIEDSIFCSNRMTGNQPSGGSGAGGLYVYREVDARISRCKIFNNSAWHGGGNIVVRRDSHATIEFSEIYGGVCEGGSQGAGNIYVIQGAGSVANSLTLQNCVIAKGANYADDGAEGIVTNSPQDSIVTVNSIVWPETGGISYDENAGSISFSYCDVRGGAPGSGNIDADPQFLSLVENNFYLKDASPCRDTGIDSIYSMALKDMLGQYVTDNSGNALYGHLDMGAYEFVFSYENDRDRDGLSDGDEYYAYGTDLDTADTDSDGLLDGYEIHLGTDPKKLDTDADAMPDGWEEAYGLDPLTDDGGSDPDGDGVTNLDEYLAGRHPTNGEPDAPILIWPEDGRQDVELSPELQTSGFLDSDGDFLSETRWQISTAKHDFSSNACIFDIYTTQHLTSLRVPELILNTNTVYYWRASFYDHRQAASEWSDIQSFSTVVADEDDSDGNGIPDNQEMDDPDIDLDANGVSDLNQDDMKIINVHAGDISVGVKSDAEVEAIAWTDPETILDSRNKPDEFPYGLIAFRVKVNDVGDYADVTVYLSEALPEDTQWYKYEPINGWYNYSGHATLNSDGRSISLQLKDGGDGDADGVANGSIIDPLGPAFDNTAPSPMAEDQSGGSGSQGADNRNESGGGAGCFIATVLRPLCFLPGQEGCGNR